MKKILNLLLILLALASCSSETEPTVEPVSGVISLNPDKILENEPQTPRVFRDAATTEEFTYIFEAWTRGDNPKCALHKEMKGTSSGTAIEIKLKPGNYDFLFWADYGKNCYSTQNLRKVSIALNNQTYTPGIQRDAFAFALKNVSWNGGNNLSVILKRPLAKLVMKNKKNFNTNHQQVSATYQNVPTMYDVLTGNASTPTEKIILKFPATTAGTDIVGEDFLFVSAEGQSIGLTILVDNTQKAVDALPIKPNFTTSVTATLE